MAPLFIWRYIAAKPLGAREKKPANAEKKGIKKGIIKTRDEAKGIYNPIKSQEKYKLKRKRHIIWIIYS